MPGIKTLKTDFHDLYQVIHPFIPIWESLPIGILVTDSQGDILFYNRAQSLIDGLSAENVLGRNVRLVYGPDPGPSLVAACLASRKPIINFVCVYRTMNDKLVNSAHWVFPLVLQGNDRTQRLLGSICYIQELDKVADAPMISRMEDLPGTQNEIMGHSKMTSKNQKMMDTIEIAMHAAATPSPVLLFGQTGTGKDLFARNIHCTSPRREKPFVTLNCSAIPETLMEGLLFGTTKGVFTGAMDKPGLFEQANGGTLFLDEMDSMPLNLQPKLLRVLQDKKIRRMGSDREIDLNLKIISAMSSDPLEAVQSGKLRPDLFYRLGVVVIGIPPLRARMEDLGDLCTFFILKYNSLMSKKMRKVSPELMSLFMQYNWPGNVRELEHLIEASMNVAHDTDELSQDMVPEYFLNNLMARSGGQAGAGSPLQSIDFRIDRPIVSTQENQPAAAFFKPTELARKATGFPPAGSATVFPATPKGGALPTLAEVSRPARREEKEVIAQALARTFGNITQAAGILGVSRQNLTYRMKKCGLTRQEFRNL